MKLLAISTYHVSHNTDRILILELHWYLENHVLVNKTDLEESNNSSKISYAMFLTNIGHPIFIYARI